MSNIKVVEASKHFDLLEMHTDLMICGMYVYHEPTMKGLVEVESINWDITNTGSYGLSSSHPAADKLKNIHLQRTLSIFPNLVPMEPFLYYGIDDGAEHWHDDAREKLGIQFLCYQEDLSPEDGGSIRVKCYDGIERWYYPKNGDVVIINHHTDIQHMVEQIKTTKKRIAINFKLKRL